jgi:hypothetical protein
LKGRELVSLLADRWQDNIKEIGVRMWFSNRCLMHVAENTLITHKTNNKYIYIILTHAACFDCQPPSSGSHTSHGNLMNYDTVDGVKMLAS